MFAFIGGMLGLSLLLLLAEVAVYRWRSSRIGVCRRLNEFCGHQYDSEYARQHQEWDGRDRSSTLARLLAPEDSRSALASSQIGAINRPRLSFTADTPLCIPLPSSGSAAAGLAAADDEPSLFAPIGGTKVHPGADDITVELVERILHEARA